MVNQTIDYNRLAIISVILLVVGISSFSLGFYLHTLPVRSTTLLELLISPGIEDDFIDLIRSANHSINLEVYAFTNKRLANALVDSKKRGVTVRVLIDEKTTSDSSSQAVLDLLSHNGVWVMFSSSQFKSTHSKFMIIDGAIAVIGSHNWSNSAMNLNREVSILLQSREIISELLGLFESDWQKARDIKVS